MEDLCSQLSCYQCAGTEGQCLFSGSKCATNPNESQAPWYQYYDVAQCYTPFQFCKSKEAEGITTLWIEEDQGKKVPKDMFCRWSLPLDARLSYLVGV